MLLHELERVRSGDIVSSTTLTERQLSGGSPNTSAMEFLNQKLLTPIRYMKTMHLIFYLSVLYI